MSGWYISEMEHVQHWYQWRRHSLLPSRELMNNLHALPGKYKHTLETHRQQLEFMCKPICAYFEGQQSNKEVKTCLTLLPSRLIRSFSNSYLRKRGLSQAPLCWCASVDKKWFGQFDPWRGGPQKYKSLYEEGYSVSRIPDTASISRVPNSWSVDTNRDIPSRVLHSEASSRISKTALSNTETSALALKKRKAKTWRNEALKGGWRHWTPTSLLWCLRSLWPS